MTWFSMMGLAGRNGRRRKHSIKDKIKVYFFGKKLNSNDYLELDVKEC